MVYILTAHTNTKKYAFIRHIKRWVGFQGSAIFETKTGPTIHLFQRSFIEIPRWGTNMWPLSIGHPRLSNAARGGWRVGPGSRQRSEVKVYWQKGTDISQTATAKKEIDHRPGVFAKSMTENSRTSDWANKLLHLIVFWVLFTMPLLGFLSEEATCRTHEASSAPNTCLNLFWSLLLVGIRLGSKLPADLTLFQLYLLLSCTSDRGIAAMGFQQ